MGILDFLRKDPEPKSDRRPLSASGRGHSNGFLDFEEFNQELLGQAGLRIFDKMYRTDGDVRQALSLVANPLIAGTWDVEPYGGIEADEAALEDVAFVKWALWDVMNPNLNGHLEELLPVLLRSGFTPFEELWTTATWDRDSKEYLVLRKLDMRLPRTIWRFYQDVYGEIASITQQLPVPLYDIAVGAPQPPSGPRRSLNGETLMPNEVEILARNMAYYRIGREGDNWEGVSMLRPAYKHWLMKDTIERIDAIAQEREAVGIPICYPPLSATPGQLDAMADVLSAMRTNEQSYIVAPGPKAGTGAPDGQGWLIEVIGYDRTGSGRDPQPSLTYHTQKIYASVLAEFIRLGHETTGARATAQVQVEPFLQAIEALSRGIEMQLQRLVDKLIAYNRPAAKQSPKIKLSKIDATSLTQLADYVLKLSQAGAMLPDRSLEEYLRLRADLPPMDPEAVKARGKGMKADTDARKEVLTGGGAFGDAPGGNKPQGGAGSSTPKSANKTKSMASDTGFYDEEGRRLRFRAYRPEENILNLDAIEDYLDAQPDAFARAAQDDVLNLAAMLGRGKNGKINNSAQRLLCNSIDLALGDVYQHGIDDAREECNTLLAGHMALSVRDQGRMGVRHMAEHGANEIVSKMQLAAQAAKLNFGSSDAASSQSASEIEGMRALRAVALGHGSSAYQQGRHDYLLEASSATPQLKLLYTALLDNRTCEACSHADDGIPRAPEDPVRLDRRPPNRHCLSNLSGHNYCRCLELPVIV